MEGDGGSARPGLLATTTQWDKCSQVRGHLERLPPTPASAQHPVYEVPFLIFKLQI